MIRSARRTARESRWLKVLGTLNEYQARLFVADKALDQGRGGISRLSELTGLINQSGTFYLIINGQREGITDPGILNSYGLSFNQAQTPTAQELNLPMGSNLMPDNGALVKTAQDPTIYLISGGQRHGFTSASAFTSLGLKWSSVLVVTAPELDGLPL